MRISVVVVTARPGGMDCLRTGLEAQTFDRNDFEVVIVDALYDRRKRLVTDYFAAKQIHCRHIPPRQRVFPIDAVPQARNAGIIKARGELILWLVDYSILPPDALREHWGVFEHFEKKRAGMAAHRYLFPPKTVYDLPEYAPCRVFIPQKGGVTYAYDEMHGYAFADDLAAGFYDEYMLSIFERPIESMADVEQLHEDQYFFHADPKRHGLMGGDISGVFFHAKGESTPRDLCISANGFDEDYIAHCYDDYGFGCMLENAGFKWLLLDSSVVVNIVNARHLFPHLVRRMSDSKFQEELCKSRGTDINYTRSSNQYHLELMSEMGSWWY